MCGIVGYCGNNPACGFVFDGLKKLEYRGYDSWGIATAGDSTITVSKKVGKISGFSVENMAHKGFLGIGHTRWATHGGVSEENTHPHLCCSGAVAVVHNGIIENYEELKKELTLAGHTFSSETDTEVIAHLIGQLLKGHVFREAVRIAASRLEGSFAFIALSNSSKDLVAVKNESPLVIGVKADGEYFVASDPSAFIEYTKNVVFLDDGQVAVLNSALNIERLDDGTPVSKKAVEIPWSGEQAKKGDFEHYMLKEISEQKSTIKAAIASDKAILDVAKKINEAYGVFFVAAGSSLHAALSASYTFSKVAKKHINVVDASEFAYYEDFLTPKTLMIAISQSGETADLLSAVKAAKKKGVQIVSIVNVMGSTLMRESDSALLMNAGPEICVLATKSYTSQLAILHLLAYAVMGRFPEGKESLKKVADDVDNLVSEKSVTSIKALSEKLKDKDHVYVIGRGLSYPTALEAALKIKEVTYIHAEGFAGGALKHGTIALIEEGTPCIVFAPNDETYGDVINNAREIQARGGYIIGVSPKKSSVFDAWIEVPDAGENFPIVNIIPIQLLSYYLAVLRGLDPDKPRNLAKSVTVK